MSATSQSLESVIFTGELGHRSPRAPNYQAENRALTMLARELTHSPDSVLQRLVESAAELCRAGSAGISLIEEEKGRKIFRWRAIAGQFAKNLLGTTPRDFSPCGVVVDRNAVELFSRPGLHYPYLDEVNPRISEALLAPFALGGERIGTVWVITHDDNRKFDSEDARVLESLAHFASAAYQVLLSLQAAKEADRGKDEFLAILSHELRSPLSSISMWIQTLLSRDLDQARRRQALVAIERASKLQARMVDDLMDSSSIVAAKLSVELEPTDLSLIVKRAVDTAGDAASEKKIDTKCIVNPNFIPMRGDSARLEQVVGNLVTNAIKFTPQGGTVTVEARCLGEEAEICVTDTGEGISPEFLPHVFDRFRQADSSLTRRHGGLGLGLAISRHLVGLHGGKIQAESKGIGHGSTFRVRLPIERELVAPLGEADSSKTPAKEQKLKGTRILVVEDDPDTRLALETALQLAGSKVRTASTTHDALRSFDAERADVVITDLAMPDADGYALLRALQKLGAERGHLVPVIALTGSVMPEDRRKVYAAGFAIHLTKPVGLTELLEAVAMASSGHAPEFADN
jgi:signal transduction histidine kinase/CheY-like chemotaxis protein